MTIRLQQFASSSQGRARAPFARCLSALVATLALSSAPLMGQVHQAKPPQIFQGKLESLPGAGPVLKTPKKDFPLAATTQYLFHTLQDRRLLNREVRLEGTARPGGTFQVERLYTVRNGKLYRVRYYCEVCNIEALEPGDCVCCQQPTELQEIPVDPNDKNIFTDH